MAEREKSLPSEGALGGKAHTLRAAVGVLGSVSTGAQNNNIPVPTFDASHSFRDKDCRVGVAATWRPFSDEHIVDTGETISGTQLTGALNGDGRVFTFRQQPTPLVHDEALGGSEAKEKSGSKRPREVGEYEYEGWDPSSLTKKTKGRRITIDDCATAGSTAASVGSARAGSPSVRSAAASAGSAVMIETLPATVPATAPATAASSRSGHGRRHVSLEEPPLQPDAPHPRHGLPPQPGHCSWTKEEHVVAEPVWLSLQQCLLNYEIKSHFEVRMAAADPVEQAKLERIRTLNRTWILGCTRTPRGFLSGQRIFELCFAQ
jgi:hypothetical protein